MLLDYRDELTVSRHSDIHRIVIAIRNTEYVPMEGRNLLPFQSLLRGIFKFAPFFRFALLLTFYLYSYLIPKMQEAPTLRRIIHHTSDLDGSAV